MGDKAKVIRDMTAEWIHEDGYITCEFSATPDEMPEICRAVYESNKDLADRQAYWDFLICRTCESHNPGTDRYIHVQIVSDKNG